MRCLLAMLISVLVLPVAYAESPEVDEIVRRAFEQDEENEEKARQYTFHRREEQRYISRDGEVAKTESKTHDVTQIFGEEYERLIAIDDKPLDSKKDADEQRKLDRHVEKRTNESPDDRRKRQAKLDKEREEQREWIAEMQKIFDFTLEGEDNVDGVNTWVIAAEPKPDYKPKVTRAKFLSKTRGKFWIAKEDFGWVKLEAETLDTVSVGLVLFRLAKGSTFSLRQRKLEEGVWMTERFQVNIDGRAAMFMKIRRQIVGEYSKFRRFSTESQLIVSDRPEVISAAGTAGK